MPPRTRQKQKRQSTTKKKKDKEPETPLSDLPLVPPSDHARIRRLYTARQTLKVMLTARGYGTDTVLPPCTLDTYLQNFEHYATTERLVHIPRVQSVVGVASETLNDEELVVFFAISAAKLGVKTLRPMLAYMHTQHLIRALILVDNDVTPEVRSDILACRQKRMPHRQWIEVFRLRELAFPKVQHSLQPKSIKLLTLAERNAVLDRYGNTSKKTIHLQCILLRDPIVRYCGALPHDVLRIERKSQTGGTAIAYRYVTHNPRNEKIKAMFNTVL